MPEFHSDLKWFLQSPAPELLCKNRAVKTKRKSANLSTFCNIIDLCVRFYVWFIRLIFLPVFFFSISLSRSRALGRLNERFVVNMEPFPMEIAFNSRCAFRSIDFFPAFNSVYLPWFAFKLDHLCLLHLIRTMIQSQLYRVRHLASFALHFYWFTLFVLRCSISSNVWLF